MLCVENRVITTLKSVEKEQCGMSNDDREAKILRERRASLGLTQDQVATEAGIEMRAYQRYEHGKVRLSSATMKIGLRICAALELDPFEAVVENGKDMAGVERKGKPEQK